MDDDRLSNGSTSTTLCFMAAAWPAQAVRKNGNLEEAGDKGHHTPYSNRADGGAGGRAAPVVRTPCLGSQHDDEGDEGEAHGDGTEGPAEVHASGPALLAARANDVEHQGTKAKEEGHEVESSCSLEGCLRVTVSTQGLPKKFTLVRGPVIAGTGAPVVKADLGEEYAVVKVGDEKQAFRALSKG